MKTLIIHPEDPTTEFLKKVYEGLEDLTVIRGGVNFLELHHEIIQHDRVIMLGHGTPSGLMSVGKFTFGDGYVIADRNVHSLSNVDDCIYIWCNADQFVQRNGMSSQLYSGMFVSEMGEAYMVGIDDVRPRLIANSNYLFATSLNEALKENDISMLKINYPVAHSNPVVAYNARRLYRNEP